MTGDTSWPKRKIKKNPKLDNNITNNKMKNIIRWKPNYPLSLCLNSDATTVSLAWKHIPTTVLFVRHKVSAVTLAERVHASTKPQPNRPLFLFGQEGAVVIHIHIYIHAGMVECVCGWVYSLPLSGTVKAATVSHTQMIVCVLISSFPSTITGQHKTVLSFYPDGIWLRVPLRKG